MGGGEGDDAEAERTRGRTSETCRRVEAELSSRCTRWTYLVMVFLLTTTPGLYNALHITVYVFIAQQPQDLTCRLQPLLDANWTLQQVRLISQPQPGDSCSVLSWDYEELAALDYDQASSLPRPNTTSPCHSFLYPTGPASSVLQEWDLVCSRSYLSSLVQVAVAFGKFVGAFTFGIIADKFGRKRCFLVASGLYVVAGPLAAWVHSFSLFLLLRFVLGLAGSAVYETGYVLLTELTVGKWRSRLSCVYGIFYPVGMVLLPLIAMNFSSWRMVQLFISLPTFLILFNCWFLPESPRWLLIKGRHEEAWKVLDRGKTSVKVENGDRDLNTPVEMNCISQTESDARGTSAEPMLVKQANNVRERRSGGEAWYKRCLVMLREVLQILTNSELRKRALICNFSWFIASLSYYVIALNGVNLTSNLYLYIALNGVFEAPGYMLPVLLISCLGRRSSSALSFLVSGTSLLLILALPSSIEWLRMTWVMVGRLWVSSVFSFITLHTSELFPTTNRNTAIGMTLTMSQIGSMSAPLLVQAGAWGWWVPSTVCGCTALVAGLLVLVLPETRDQPLLDTVQDVRPSSSSLCCCTSTRST